MVPVATALNKMMTGLESSDKLLSVAITMKIPIGDMDAKSPMCIVVIATLSVFSNNSMPVVR